MSKKSVALVFWFLSAFFFNSSSAAEAQTLLGTVPATRPITSCETFAVKPGDKIKIDASIDVGPTPPGPTEMTVTTSTGDRFMLSSDHNREVRSYTVNSSSFKVCIVALRNFDQDDSGRARVYLEPRPNLVADAPIQQPNGDVTFSYHNPGSAWDPRGQRVEVKLYFAHGRTKVGAPLAARDLLLNANAHGSFTIPSASIPAVPQGVTHLLSVIDEFNTVVNETTEADNVALTELPNLRVTTPSYDEDGNISYGYSVTSDVRATTIHYVTVQLYYSPQRDTSALDRSRLIHESTLDLKLSGGAGRDFTLKVGTFPLPPPEARYMVAVIDLNNAIREQGVNDNAASAGATIAPGYAFYSGGTGVGVWRRRDGGKYHYAVVADLSKATLGHFESTGLPSVEDYWGWAESLNPYVLPVRAVVNTTFFEGSYVGGYTPSIGLKSRGVVVGYGDRLASTHPRPLPPDIVQLFEFRAGSASLLSYRRAYFDDPQFENLVGVFKHTYPIDSTVRARRNWIGLRDPVGVGSLGERRYRTVIFLLSDAGLVQNEMREELQKIGAQAMAQADGSASTALAVSGNPPPLVRDSILRFLPYVIAVYGNR